MRVTHVISSIDKNSGGTSAYMKALIESMDDKEIVQELIAFDSPQNISIKGKLELKLSQPKGFSRFYSKDIQQLLLRSEADLFHGNGLWESPVRQMASVALRRRLPYIVSPHGMLEEWSLKQSHLKKKIALKLFQFKALQNANCLHATALMEAHAIRAKGLVNPIAVIPNGIDLEEFTVKSTQNNTDFRKILFLSRIHAKKGIEVLIEAWNLTSLPLRQGWQIEIIGNGDTEYIEDLKKIVFKKGLEDSIKIMPPVFGIEKVKAYHEADVFVLPTFSENFGIVVAEALACGVPVVTTTGTPWEELNTNGCGWWIETGVNPLVDVLKKILLLKKSELQILGLNGRDLVERKYSMSAVANQMYRLYDWILNPDLERPEFIKLD